MRERVTTDQIKLARTVDLISYMQQYEPEELIRTGPHDYKTATHSSLCISDNGLWHWYSRGIGGRGALNYLIQVNEQERHLDWTELNEELLSRRSAQEPAPVEDAVYESMQTQALREGVNQLPEVQKRRLQMYFFDGLTYEEIAVREGCSYQAVQKSIAAALKKIRKFLK